MKDWEIIAGIADLVTDGDPHRLTERTFDALVGGPEVPLGRAAIFTRDQERMSLFSSRGADQSVLGLVEYVWTHHRTQLEKGQPFVAEAPPAETTEAAVRSALRGAVRLAVVPIKNGPVLVGVLYVDSREASREIDLAAAIAYAHVARIVVRGVLAPAPAPRQRVVETYLEKTPLEDISRDQLLVLLHKNEWNISRVARVIDVSRRTLYLRLARYGIERVKVRLTRKRAEA